MVFKDCKLASFSLSCLPMSFTFCPTYLAPFKSFLKVSRIDKTYKMTLQNLHIYNNLQSKSSVNGEK